MSEKRQMLVDLATGEAHPAPAETPILSSAKGPWPGVMLEHHSAGSNVDLANMVSREHVVVVKLAEPSVAEWGQGDKRRTLRFLPGQALLIPALVPFTYRTPRSGEIIIMTVGARFLRCAAHDLFTGSDRLELQPIVPLDDPLLPAVALSLKAEVAAGYPGGRVYGESLATSLAVHLVSRYSNARPLAQTNRSGLPRQQLRLIVDYIHDHLAEEVSLAVLAAQAGLSPFHFARLFRQTTGLSPHQYLLRCRVEHSRELLLSSRLSIVQIALRAGFCDQSHLTTHFKRMFGLTPKQFRQQMGPRGLSGRAEAGLAAA